MPRPTRPCALSRSSAAALVLALALTSCDRPVPLSELPERARALEQPNIVFVLVDTLRADWLTPYGYERNTSPELARWAERGVLFERVRSQSSWTKTSVASLLTSLWPRSHGVAKVSDGLAEGAVTLAEVFSEAGYSTYGVQTNGWLHQSFGFHQGFDSYRFPHGQGARGFPQSMVWPHGDRIFEETQRLLEAHDPSRPFFLYLHFMDVHQYAAPREFKKFGTGEKADYVSSIRWVDDVLERLRRDLDDRGFLDQTIMVFGSDHGETFGENGVHGHAINVLTPVLWVPLVIRFPFPIEPMRVSEQVRNLDIAPTLLELAAIEQPESFEGTPLMRVIMGAEDADRVTYAQLEDKLVPAAVRQASVNDGSWTLARNLDDEGKEFLYDRAVDPAEDVNLITHEPAQAERMRALLDAYLSEGPLPDVSQPDVRIDPEIARKLRALGYLAN